MGKWLRRLEEKTAAPPYGGTDKTAKSPLLSVLAVGSEGGAPEIAHAAPAADRRLDILARLLRWGWPRAVAEATSERIARRDADDDRRSCAECLHYTPGRCGSHGRAGLGTDAMGRDLAALQQRCPGFDVAPGAGERLSNPVDEVDRAQAAARAAAARCGWTDPERAAWLADASENPAGVLEALSPKEVDR